MTLSSAKTRTERLAFILVLLVFVGLPLALLGGQGFARLRASSQARTIELTARLPTADQGGWTPDLIRVQKGERVRLRLTSADVMHGFAIPKLGIDAGWVEPGKVKEVEFIADQPGRYHFLCTVFCESSHWRMRGVLEVVYPDDALASERDPQPPTTDWQAAGIDIDAPHPGANVPGVAPDAARGAEIWQGLSQRGLSDLFTEAERRQLSPSDIFDLLGSGSLPEADRLAALSPAERWDIVAAIFFDAAPEAALDAGARLYLRDCTGCHGASGRGDGPAAAAINTADRLLTPPAADAEHGEHNGMNRPVTDFTDLNAQMGASDLLYYGKLVRGGMGTSMPYWGGIYTEDELWAVIAQLRRFAFTYPDTSRP